MRGLSRARWATGAAVVALVVSACGGGGGEEPDAGATGAAGGPTGAITYAGCKPQNPLVPTNTQETCGGDILDALFTGLIRYDTEDASSVNEIAESIEPDANNTTFTIKIKDDWTFHDGTPIKAKNFVDAWNYGAWPGNAQLNSYFFEDIKGFTYGDDKNGDGTVDAKESANVPKELEGLKVVDDTTFTVTLNAPYGNWPARLGYSAFVPLPDSAFTDIAAFGKNPVGTGPFKLVSHDPATSTKVTAYDGYKGSNPPKIKDIDFKVYTSEDAAYADLISNNVDFQQTVPSAALAGSKYKTDLGEGRYIDKAIGVFQSMTFASGDKRFEDVNLRKAISMAIDREAVIKVAFDGARQPADGWVPPVVDGYKENQCGELCTFNPEEAKRLFDQAGGFDGTMTIAYNADGGHKEWVDATCTSIANTLGVKCQGKAYVDFATFRTDITERKIRGIFRTGWQMDYPSIENFLITLYKTDAGSNDGDYSNPEFDKLVNEAARKTGDEAIALYQQSAEILAEDVPVVPLWFGQQQSGWSDKVDNVKIKPFGTLDYTQITVKG